MRWRRRPPSGVNVVGYLDSTGGLADRARELVACLRAMDVGVSEWPLPAPDGRSEDHRERTVYDTTVAVVTAVQMATARVQVPEAFERCRRTIGYFFWELAAVPDEQHWGIGLVDEIWTPTSFVHDAYRSATERPVRVVPVPIAPPTPSGRDRAWFGFGDEVVFLANFDYLSSMQRKNPAAAIDAFERAFPAGDEQVRLVVKSINADSCRVDRDALAAHALGDPRVELRDGRLDPDDLAALIAAADVFVSLHRSEGLGLHLAEAMWLGTPVIATGYSGSLDVTGEAAALVDHRLVAVSGGGDAYTGGVWAEPDIDHAASLMSELAADGGARLRLAERARSRMASQPDRADAGRRIRSLLAEG